MENKEEAPHFIEVLEKTKLALTQENTVQLKALSDQTIHSASVYQDTDSISIAVIIYAVSKLIEKKRFLKLSPNHWNKFTKKFNSSISLAIKAIKEKRFLELQKNLGQARKAIESCAPGIKPIVQDVLKKASINKASKIYEHGISLGQTAKLLGLNEWELAEYTGQRSAPDNKFNESITVEKRAKLAMEFFS